MASDAIGEFSDHDQQVAVCLSQYQRHQSGAEKSLKILDENRGLIGGYGIPFGGPVLDGRDLEGEFFANDTDFHFDWFPQEGRPVLYEHGLDADLRLEPVGRQQVKIIDEKLGVWTAVQLDTAGRYFKALMELAKQGVLGLSSGALRGYVRKMGNGKIVEWPWVELSLTPRPANPYALIEPEAVKHFTLAGIALSDALKAQWDTAYINNLPDSAFAVIKPGGKKDDSGRTTPRDLRMLPHHDEGGALNRDHLAAARARVDQENTDLTDAQRAEAQAHLARHAEQMSMGDAGKFAEALTSIKQSTLAETATAALNTLLAGIDDATATIASLLGFDERAFVAIKAGRVMSAANMDRMHNAMKAMGAMHDALCDGNDCPMGGGSDGGNAGGDAQKTDAQKAIHEFEAIVARNGGSKS